MTIWHLIQTIIVSAALVALAIANTLAVRRMLRAWREERPESAPAQELELEPIDRADLGFGEEPEQVWGDGPAPRQLTDKEFAEIERRINRRSREIRELPDEAWREGGPTW